MIKNRGVMHGGKLSNQELIALLDVYQNEYIHRDQLFLVNIFKFFIATLVIILLPDIPSVIKIEFSVNVPEIVFLVLGIIMSIIFIYFALSNAKKMKACTETYKKINKEIPIKYQRINVEDLPYSFIFRFRLSIFLPILMFFILIIINLFFFIIRVKAKI